MSRRSDNRVSTLVVLLGSAAGGIAGALGGAGFMIVVGTLLGCLGSALVVAVLRVRATGRALDTRAAVSLHGLAPDQALAVVSAATSASLDSPLLRELRALEQQPPASQLPRLEELRHAHPRSPAVAAALARAHGATQSRELADRHAAAAVSLALDGGMNPAAASAYAEFFAEGDCLALRAADRARLVSALVAAGHPETAAVCERQADGEQA